MTRYFMTGTEHAASEREMMAIPNFKPRGGGVSVSAPYRYKAEDVDCKYCTEWQRKQCIAERCLWLKERMEAGALFYRELTAECFAECKPFRLRARIKDLSSRFGGSIYAGEDHAKRMRVVQMVIGITPAKVTPMYLAALYLLTSSHQLWKRTENAFSKTDIEFELVKLSGVSVDDYTLYQAAKSIFTGRMNIMAADLADSEIVSDEVLFLIVNAILIARYGADVLEIKQ